MTRLILILLTAMLAATPAAFAAPPSGGDGHGSGGGDSERRRMITSSEGYVPLSPLTASVHADYRIRGVLQIEAGLEIPDSRLRARAQRLMPRLRDAYVAALSRYAGANYRYGDVPDTDRISLVMQETTDEILGQDGADFLLGMVIIHDQ
ncbi:hypothetical protein [Hyphobacterium marinum]|uniref:Flagellar protein FliL n=1 Tax=Hyphobacterium marinum TaxID=3116574 RepID=A0ABU7LUD8_9PROT|nr:hypothetical protein [Hyphobacterium sp. Y6023]MEE2565174.1 hypothetical protein [Hyphobacterium sp. Y6023]